MTSTHTRTREEEPHLCHHPRCATPVPPQMFACRGHWYALPKHFRDAIWAAYIPGQEQRKDPSEEYLAAATAAVDWWWKEVQDGE